MEGSRRGISPQRTTKAWDGPTWYLPNSIEIGQAVFPPGQVGNFVNKHRS